MIDINDKLFFSTWLFDKDNTTALYKQIATYIKGKIDNDDIYAGYVFPTFRKMEDFFQASRFTLSACFDMLVAEGYVTQNSSRRFVVADRSITSDVTNVNWQHFIKRANHTIVKEVMSQPHEMVYQDNTQTSTCFLDENEFDTKQIYVDALKKVADKISLTHRLYTKGNHKLREYIANYLKKKDINVKPSQILITQTEHSAMYIMFTGLLSPTSTLISTMPNRFIENSILELTGTQVAHVDYDDDGIIIDDLYAKVKNSYNPILYLEPNYVFPVGSCMKEERKLEILELCKRKGVPIVESDYQQDYTIEQHPPIKAYDDGNNVLYQSSFGTYLNYTDSIAYIIGSEYIIEHLTYIHMQITSQCTSISQLLYLELLESGVYERFIADLKPKLHQRLIDADNLLNKYLSIYATWQKPEGSIFVLVRFNRNIKFSRMNLKVTRCNWYYMPDVVNSIVITFTSSTLAELEGFIKDIATECEKQLKRAC